MQCTLSATKAVLSGEQAISVTAKVTFAFIFSFYNLFNLSLQWWYYGLGAEQPELWKTQAKRTELLGKPATVPWIPWLFQKSGRPWWHALLMATNSCLAALAAAFTAEMFVRGSLPMHGDAPAVPAALDVGTEHAALRISTIALLFAVEVTAASLWENVVEYYWHRMMHLPWCYRHMHKLHHSYKSPTPFDDMMIHPLEAVGYYCILYSPAWLFGISVYSFMGYMAIMGVTGVTDHSGIHFRDPITGGWLYNSAEHDLHHEAFDVNYGFPSMFLDRLHGTYKHPRRPGQSGPLSGVGKEH